MRKTRLVFLTQGALIAAMYTALTLISNAFGLAGGAIQIRLSEALTVLPCFTPAAIPGLFVGCILSNLLTGCAVWDVVFGSLATLIGAIFTRLIREHRRLAPLPPIVANTAVIPFVLRYAYGLTDALPFLFATVFVGELISCGILGTVLLAALKKHENHIFYGGR